MAFPQTAFVGSLNPTLIRPSRTIPCIDRGLPFRQLQLNRRVRPLFQMCAGNNSPSGGTDNVKKIPRELKPEVKELRSVLKKCSIYLVGPMGSGKSVLAKYLAYELGFRFLDTDELIEKVAQKSIPKIFEDDGEDNFRDLESAILDQVQPFIACCVATGGGIVLRKENWGRLQTGIVIYLSTPIDVLVDRLKGDTKRPLLKDAESLTDRVTEILNNRRHLYEQADVVVPIEPDAAVDEIGMDLVRRLTNFIKANPPRLSKLYPGNLKKESES